MDNSNPAFILILISEGIVTESEALGLLEKHNGNAMAVLEHVVEKNPSQKHTLGRVWGDSVNAAYVDLDTVIFQPEIVKKLPEKFARKNRIIPLYQFGQMITVAAADPVNQDIIEAAGELIGMPISPVFAYPKDIQDAINIHYKLKDYIRKLISTIPEEAYIDDPEKMPIEQIKKIAGYKPYSDLISALILQGIKERASEIQFEKRNDFTLIYFRINDQLQGKYKVKGALFYGLSAKLKQITNISPAKCTNVEVQPFSKNISGVSYDFILNIVPCNADEKIVLKILKQISLREIQAMSGLDLS